MKKRLCALLAALMLLSMLPAQAAGKDRIQVMGTNGTITAGVRYRDDGEAGPVYTTDGVNWRDGVCGESLSLISHGHYAGGRFWLYESAMYYFGPVFCSDDGIHWRRLEHDEPVSGWAKGTAQVGDHRFELSQQGTLWLTRAAGNSGIAAALPVFREMAPPDTNYFGFYDIQAYYGPGDTVVVDLYDSSYRYDGSKLTASFTKDSLDWVLENQGSFLRMDGNSKTTDGKLTIRQRLAGMDAADPYGNGEYVIEYSYDDLHYARFPDAPWGGDCQLLPYNGKTFMVLDLETADIFASEDGSAWKSLRGTYLRPNLPEEVYPYATSASVRMQWTGSEYVTCQRIAEGIYGMVGTGGGFWYDPASTKICWADADFQVTEEYDFDRQVMGVGYYGGAWYAQVKDDPEMGERYFDWSGSDTLYVSRDKKNWEKTDILQIMEAMRRL